FTIEGMQDIVSVTVLDLYGRQISNHDVCNQPSINIHLDLPAGLYVVRLSDGTRSYHAKITVR
ncbi:MAG: T9SS type A sorting domain-containing protein, partial [Bacteroidales bacterium]